MFYNIDLEDNKDVGKLLESRNVLSALVHSKNTNLPMSFKNGEVLKTQPSILFQIMITLLSRLISDTSKISSDMSKNGSKAFTAKNETQFFKARTVSLIYIKASVLDRFLKYLEDPIWKLEEKRLMTKLSALYGLWCLEEHASSLLR